MQNKLLIAIVCWLVALPGIGQAKDYTIIELYQLAIAKDPAVHRADARLESGKADREIASAALQPRISANAALRHMWHKVYDYAGENPDGDYTGHSYGIGSTMQLVNLPAYYQLAVADAGINSAESGIHAMRQHLIVRLIDAYVLYLKAKADEKLFREEMSRVGKVLEQAQAFLKAGTGDIITVYETKARLDSAAADLVKTEGQLRLAQQNLTILTGVTVDSVQDITVAKSEGPQPAEIDWWLDTMLQRNPELKKAKDDLLQAEAGTKAAHAGHYPVLDSNLGYTVDKGSTFLPDVETRQWYVGVRINVPIYSGGDTEARIRRALAGESERLAILDDTRENAVRRLKEAYVNLQYNVSLVAAYRRRYESSELQLKAVQKGRDIGTRTAIDLLNSEQSYAMSRRDLAAALYDNLQRRLELKAAAGILAEKDLTELNGMLVENSN